VTRLTPHFHDITLENVTAVDSASAGAIVGLPEAPVKNVVLKNVKIGAKQGLTIGYAQVIGEGVVVTPGIAKGPGADVQGIKTGD
jgi:hypothetical protein